jgi:alkylation response protein AidB-like acyl-CoA dehydrogenase
MNLTLTPEQEMLVAQARAFLARASPLTHVRAMEVDRRGFDPARWREIAALGWTAAGRSGHGVLDLVLLAEEMGRVLFPSPFVPTAIVAAPLLPADRLRPETIAVLAVAEPGWRDEWGEPAATLRADGVHGTKCFVPYAADADLLVVVVAGPALVVVERGASGLELTRLTTSGGEPLYDVRFSGTPGVALEYAEPALDTARARAVVGTLAYLVGAAERALEMTVAYANTRVQFGRPIGSFQAVAHRCVDMRSDIDALRWLVYQAAWAIDATPEWMLPVSAAKAYGNEALRRVFMHAHQVHGAIGFSIECDLQLFTRRAKAAELTWGGTAAHRARVARAMGLG